MSKTQNPNHGSRPYRCSCALQWPPFAVGMFLISVCGPVWGHEGHQPLPTKGVQIDLQTGHLALSQAACDVLGVQAVEVQTGHVEESIHAYVTIVPPWTHHAFVASRLPGRIVALHVRPGDFIEAGQVLAELESLDLQTLRLDYQNARNDLDLSVRLLETTGPAAKGGAIPEQRLVEAENSYRQNENALEVLRAKALGLHVEESELASSNQQDLPPLRLLLRSSIRGTVLHADLAVGKFVEPAEHLFEIVDTSTVWARIGVLEKDLSDVREGQIVQVQLNGLPGQTFETRINKLGLLLDGLTHQGSAWAEIRNSATESAVLPGMNGQAEILLQEQSQGLIVPTAAVFSDGAERYVFVQETSTRNSSEYRKKPVAIGRQSKSATEIINGDVYPGDRVVTQGGHELSSLFFLGVLRVSPETARSIGLRVEPVGLQSVEQTLSFNGAIDVPPQLRTAASSQLPGTVHAIHADRGQLVKAGEVLAEIASLEVQDMQLDLLRTHLDALLWNDTYLRMKNAGDAVRLRNVLELESRVKGLESRYANLRQKLLTLGLTPLQIDEIVATSRIRETIPVRAPIDGVVVQFNRILGQVIRADESLFEIHDLSQPWVQVFLSERDASHVQLDQDVRLRFVACSSLEFQGTVGRLGPVVDRGSRSQAAWIQIQKLPPIPLQHNMLAQVVLTTGRPDPTLAVPQSAVVRDGLRSFVFVQKADGTFDRRQVYFGRADDRFLEIISGLAPGEQIATSGVSQLQAAYAALR